MKLVLKYHPDKNQGNDEATRKFAEINKVPNQSTTCPFRRDGNDLHMTINITLVEALVGFEKSFKHLDDHGVDIGSKGITNPKEVKKFKGEGMPLHYSTKKGNLVTFEVMFPSSLTEDQKKKIKEVLA
ncbi:PREDICTED: dnaJ protein ERDJ3B-like [Brassica oleracea var. oleracea]|uniref:dnaJ protein ERDJ3B-like n=1 Tax=Brassica oleracea var. oleracea TaxID=109376 RepID=UPI0006A745E1|nr:PREDICTED: dnaJ protein ERDJ3B-like [Brassica oleracea var. oleracea]